MFKFYELLSKITCFETYTIGDKKIRRGFNIAFENPSDNLGFLKIISKQWGI